MPSLGNTLPGHPQAPHTPTGERGHSGKHLPTLLAISCKKTVFTSCKTGNWVMNTGHFNLPTNPLSTEKWPHTTPFNEQKKN